MYKFLHLILVVEFFDYFCCISAEANKMKKMKLIFVKFWSVMHNLNISIAKQDNTKMPP